MMEVIEVAPDLAGLEERLAALPNQPAVFLLWPERGEPYLARTSLLRRRLVRLLGRREKPSRWLNLRDTVRRIEYVQTGSAYESGVRMYELARRHFPERHRELLKLRLPPYVKIVLDNPFPRSQITTHLGRAPALYYGPFRSRASAERFEAQVLDLFQMRRCQEDLAPSPEHPGCMYGEMSMCLRPCQQVVGTEEYAHEVERVVAFLKTDGASLSESIARARDRLSQEMLFEEAARQHKRWEKVHEVLRLRDELAVEIERLHGVAVTPSAAPNAVELFLVEAGHCQPPRRLTFAVEEGKTISLDHRLRQVLASGELCRLPARLREEHLALLSRWYYSSWREGEWVAWLNPAEIPYRKLVHAVSRVARRPSPISFGTIPG